MFVFRNISKNACASDTTVSRTRSPSLPFGIVDRILLLTCLAFEVSLNVFGSEVHHASVTFVFDMSSIPPVVSMSTYSLMEPFWLLEGVRRPFRCVLPLPNMEPRRQEFCGPYQQARQVGGRPMCSYTSRSCPFGRHACRTCGRVGWQEAADATRK